MHIVFDYKAINNLLLVMQELTMQVEELHSKIESMKSAVEEDEKRFKAQVKRR